MATYFITGAGRGLGLELSKQLLDLPADQVSLVFVNTRSSPPSAALAALIASSNGRAKHIVGGVDGTDGVEAAARQVEAHLGGGSEKGGLDVLINNAGTAGEFHPGGKLVDCPPEELASILNTNAIGPHRVTRALLPLLRRGKQKKIINM